MRDIVTRRLILRPWKLSDSKDLYEYSKSELVGPRAGWKPHKSEEESKETIKMFIKNNDSYAIVLRKENKVIGGIGLHKRKPDSSLKDLKQREIGYVLNPNYWGSEYIPEAVKALIQYGFMEMNLDLIWCGHFDFNSNSKRVNEKCGFNYKLTKKEIIKSLDNMAVNALYYNISKDEYLVLNSKAE
ncbi:MAG: GNAT family N-acetyltransferase [Clostridium sp.]|uniref:GNAT family N-acetyltransferase n=1 Tax=Clostridium sp. TaxID=1506 RepID=UPI0025C6A907|nr:GNAT family N-acetyltransferase [Clostridium sp.]MCF0146839.1 GNAT family N-acetyltransferase [Clostridium sp.]